MYQPDGLCLNTRRLQYKTAIPKHARVNRPDLLLTSPFHAFRFAGSYGAKNGEPIPDIVPVYFALPEGGDIGVYGIAVLANFSCGVSVISTLNCSKPAGNFSFADLCVLVDDSQYKNVSFTFSRPFLAVSCRFRSIFCPRVNESTSYTGSL